MNTTKGIRESDAAELRQLIAGMRAAYERGENTMEFARRVAGTTQNSAAATLIAYDLQAGSYVAATRADPQSNARWCAQLVDLLDPLLVGRTSLLEVGCGEATTLCGVLRRLTHAPTHAMGFDISWSRCTVGREWLAENGASARLFVADLFEIPLEDNSVDLVYTSHSIEPNGGRETDAIRELMRVAREAVVLVEPLYEFAGEQAQARMRHHGYVRELKSAAEALGARITDYRLLDYTANPSNPSGVLVLHKADGTAASAPAWRCPLTHVPLGDAGDAFIAEQTGIAYPVLRGIPLLRAEHAIVASKLGE